MRSEYSANADMARYASARVVSRAYTSRFNRERRAHPVAGFVAFLARLFA